MPAVPSSILADANKNLLIPSKGFTVNVEGSNWRNLNLDESSNPEALDNTTIEVTLESRDADTLKSFQKGKSVQGKKAILDDFARKNKSMGKDLEVDEKSDLNLTFENIKLDSAILQVTTASLKKKMNHEDYGKLWISEYSSLGFDVLGSQLFSNNKKVDGMFLDLVHKKSGRSVRQAYFIKDKLVVLFTCQNKVKEFAATIKECNQVIKNFAWK